jgi:translin
MGQFDLIAEGIHQAFEARTAARDRALTQARTLTRHCANAIRAIHRDERPLAQDHLAEARKLVDFLHTYLTDYPDLYYAGYTQDALKEYAEACLVYALVFDETVRSPHELALENATYLQGLAEAAGELRRRCLDMLLKDNPPEAERLLHVMDDIYAILVTMDYPDAITGGLRRLTDVARSIIERTRGDLTLNFRQEHLEKSISRLERRLEDLPDEDHPRF